MTQDISASRGNDICCLAEHDPPMTREMTGEMTREMRRDPREDA